MAIINNQRTTKMKVHIDTCDCGSHYFKVWHFFSEHFVQFCHCGLAVSSSVSKADAILNFNCVVQNRMNNTMKELPAHFDPSKTPLKLRQSQWDTLKRDIETRSTGATIHNEKLKFSFVKDRIEFLCHYWNGEPEYQKYGELCGEYKTEALQQLNLYGYDDFSLFIENYPQEILP